MTRALVTGGSGFIGSALCNRMADDGHNVAIFDSRVRGTGMLRDEERFAIVEWDIRGCVAYSSVPAVTDALSGGMGLDMNGADVVFHLAAVNGTSTFYSDPWRVLDVQIRGTLNVIDACVKRGVKTLVLFSSSEVYQTPPVIPTPESVPLSIPDVSNPRYSYAGGKIAAELLAWHSPIERVIVIRPHQVYGANAGYDHVIPQFIMRAARTPDGGTFDIHGQSTRSFIYIDDFTDAMMAIWKNVNEREGKVREIYHVGTEEQVSMTALAGMISDIMGRKRGDKYAYRFKTYAAPVGGTPFRCPDTKKIRGLGWSPKVSLREGLERTVAAYRAKENEWPT